MVSLYVAAASSTAAMSFALKYILSFGRFTFVMLRLQCLFYNCR